MRSEKGTVAFRLLRFFFEVTFPGLRHRVCKPGEPTASDTFETCRIMKLSFSSPSQRRPRPRPIPSVRRSHPTNQPLVESDVRRTEKNINYTNHDIRHGLSIYLRASIPLGSKSIEGYWPCGPDFWNGEGAALERHRHLNLRAATGEIVVLDLIYVRASEPPSKSALRIDPKPKRSQPFVRDWWF